MAPSPETDPTVTTGPAVIIGAGPAGLACAWELGKRDRPAIVYEMTDIVGGISQTATHNGNRFDIGGHRFFTKVSLVQEMWDEILQEPFLERPRLSRIYYRGKFFDYPLKPLNALTGLGPIESVRIGLSWLYSQAFPEREETNFEQWVINRFGRRLYEIFFKTYTEKVWGTPCTEIGSDWAAQRIKNLNLLAAVKDALLPGHGRGGEIVTTLIDKFKYPRHGPGQMWEDAVEGLRPKGIDTHLHSRVERLFLEDGRVVAAGIRKLARPGANEAKDGGLERVPASSAVSSMPLPSLLRALDPPPPSEVLAAGARLKFRDFLTVVLIVDQDDLFPDNWIYIHAPEVKLGRIQNFKNWSPDMVADPSTTSLGLEYFVTEGDELWTAADDDLVALGTREVEQLGLLGGGKVLDAAVVRMPKAYPVYDEGHREAMPVIQAYLDSIPNLHPVGRNGQHRYNNQDHSMVTGVYAARNIDGENLDLWSVNVEQDYHEEVRDGDDAADSGGTIGTAGTAVGARSGDRLTPQAPKTHGFESRVRQAFARYDPVALGGAIGILGAAAIFLATTILLLRPETPKGPTLSLLGNYFFGYEVSWRGCVAGMLEAGALGFGFGYLLARLINALVGGAETALRRDLEMARILE